jgi:hypothetical protein
LLLAFFSRRLALVAWARVSLEMFLPRRVDQRLPGASPKPAEAMNHSLELAVH